MEPIRYRVEHETRYGYAAQVSHSRQLARLTPRTLAWQQVHTTELHIDPVPDERHDAVDRFGNTVTHFGVLRGHRVLRVRMASELTVAARAPVAETAEVPWEAVRDALLRHAPGSDLMAAQLSEPTRTLPLSEAARSYAAPSFTPGRSWIAATTDLMQRIHADFAFDADATTVSSSVEEVLDQRRGVCQDFAHLMIAGLRGHGLPARYVSGYLLTEPPAGSPRLMGVDASHAWVGAWAPGQGWLEFDPTNDQLADTRYITLGWGADYADIGPLRGVLVGSGAQSLNVSVSVIPL